MTFMRKSCAVCSFLVNIEKLLLEFKNSKLPDMLPDCLLPPSPSVSNSDFDYCCSPESSTINDISNDGLTGDLRTFSLCHSLHYFKLKWFW